MFGSHIEVCMQAPELVPRDWELPGLELSRGVPSGYSFESKNRTLRCR